MSVRSIAGIRRDAQFSPNQVGNDEAIFSAVAQWLAEAGHEVHLYAESEFLVNQLRGERCIFTMLRSKPALAKLQEWERQGGCAINSGFGIENCMRERMTSLLTAHHISYPPSLICQTADGVPENLLAAKFEPCWVKRADAHAVHREDVAFAGTESELAALLERCASRGISRVVINKHTERDLLKFYGVSGSDFFYWFYPQVNGHSKFGWEAVNGAPRGIPFEEEALRHLCHRAASVLQVQVYGGDCIVATDGQIYLIDLNDWPSFAPCRQEAAVAIGQLIQKSLAND